MRIQAQYHNSNWFVFPPLPHNFLLSRCSLLSFAYYYCVVVFVLSNELQQKLESNQNQLQQQPQQLKNKHSCGIWYRFEYPKQMTRIVYKTHSHTHTHSFTWNGGSWGDPSAQPPTRHIPFEGVLQSIPIHQRGQIAQEYIGYKSVRYISSVHQLAYFLCHSSIILQITSANFQNFKCEIFSAYVTKCPLNAVPHYTPLFTQLEPEANFTNEHLYIYAIYYTYVCVCCICTYKNIFILMNLYSCLFPALTEARSTATWCFYILANIVWEKLNSIRLCNENRDFIAQVHICNGRTAVAGGSI